VIFIIKKRDMICFLIPDNDPASLRLEQRSFSGMSQQMQAFYAIKLLCSDDRQKKRPLVNLF
jgi:hypothetical protein